jgi:hypothetical protein
LLIVIVCCDEWRCKFFHAEDCVVIVLYISWV